MDGQLLARAREEKENIRIRALSEDARRHSIAYSRVPSLRLIDARLSALVGEVAAAAQGIRNRPIEEMQRESLDLQARRAELLVANRWPLDWLDGAWTCAKCRDTGFIHGQMCSCLKELYDKQRSLALSALLKLGCESFDSFDLTYYSEETDQKTGRSPRRHMTAVYGFCRDYADEFGPGSLNLLFWGGTGLGKTFLSACIARVVSEKGYSVVYETTVDALAAFEAQKFHPSDEADGRVDRLTDCDLLILDDLGTEMVTEFTKSALYTLINLRLLGGRKTIVSTNLKPAQLAKFYSPQIASRLQGEYQDLPFVGTDIRLMKKERGL